jgi:hypothetical protein
MDASEFLVSIQAKRKQRFHQDRQGLIQTEEEALQFINEMGFCLFATVPDVELPSLALALSEEKQTDLWGWKDSLAISRQVYYGSLFHPRSRREARPGFATLRMLAALYALSPILQFGGDRELLRRWVKISPEAVVIAEVLERAGSLSTGDLREGTGLTGKTNATRFSKGLDEAQAHFMVSKVGVTSTTRANYGYVWASFERVFPEAIRQAEGMTEIDAAEAVLVQFVQTAIAVPLERIAEILALDLRVISPAAERLVEQGKLCAVEVAEHGRNAARWLMPVFTMPFS